MRRYRVKRADRAAIEVEVGVICYRMGDFYGCASDDTRVTGIEHVCASLNKETPFFTIPLEDLEEEANSMHDLLRGLPGGLYRQPWDWKQPWDWQMIPPMSLDDEPVLSVLIKWKKGDEWETHRYRITLEKMDT